MVPKVSGQNTKVGSPALCQQKGDWIDRFQAAGSVEWDFTVVHIYQDSIDKVAPVLGDFAKYGKPLWVSEFACVNSASGFEACRNKSQMQTFIRDMADLLQKDERVAAYSALTEGNALPADKWNFVANGQLTETGQVYLDAISKYN